jgi:hypothetical protein
MPLSPTSDFFRHLLSFCSRDKGSVETQVGCTLWAEVFALKKPLVKLGRQTKAQEIPALLLG